VQIRQIKIKEQEWHESEKRHSCLLALYLNGSLCDPRAADINLETLNLFYYVAFNLLNSFFLLAPSSQRCVLRSFPLFSSLKNELKTLKRARKSRNEH
jgi:hypothetical protein